MQQRKQVWTTLPGGRVKRVQGRFRGEKRDRFGRSPDQRRSQRRAERQAFRAAWQPERASRA